jgi:hypothetical protein
MIQIRKLKNREVRQIYWTDNINIKSIEVGE